MILIKVFPRNLGKRVGGVIGMIIDIFKNGCEAVAVESTGSYWIPIYHVLEGHVNLIVANAYKIKHIPGRKTDKIDSEWIAELCLNGLIQPSRIFPENARNLRSLTRARELYVDDMTREKNRIHHVLDSCCIKLSSVISDIFSARLVYISSTAYWKRWALTKSSTKSR